MNKKISFVLFSIFLIISSAFAQDYNIPLKAGDNLISLPLIPQDTNISNILSPIISQVKDVWEFNPADAIDPWKHYQPGLEDYSDLSEMNTGKGYWINLKTEVILKITGTSAPENAPVNFKAGWNIIGWPYQYSQGVTTTLCALSFGTDYNQVSRFNSTTKVQEDFLNQPASDNFSSFDPLGGYYIYALKDIAIRTALPLESEPNNNLPSANPLALNSSISGSIFQRGDKDYFKIILTQPGEVSVSLNNVPANIRAGVYFYNSNGNGIGYEYSTSYGGNVNLRRAVASAGEYYIAVFDSEGAHSSASLYSLNLRFSTLYFTAYSATSVIFSPNADEQKDTTTITAQITASSNWTLNIKDSTGAIKRTYTGTGSAINRPWDGKDSAQQIVPDGIYTYTIDATDPATSSTAAQVSGTITVDNTLPTATITEPASGAVISGTVAFKGINNDLNFYSAYLFYGQGTNPASWNYISSIAKVGPEPGLLYNWNTTSLANGDYVIRLETRDQAGNIKRHDLPVKLYNVAIYNVARSPEFFSPNADGNLDTTKITADLTGNANWTIEIKDINDNLLKTYTGSGNKISQAWDGKNSSNQVVTDARYKYIISAVDPLTSTHALPVSGGMTVDNTKPAVLVSEPANNQQISGKFNIKGLAKDLNYNGNNYQCFLAYGEGASPTSWKVVKWLYQPIVEDPDGNPSLIYQWDTAGLPNGIYTLHLSVMDAAGNFLDTKILMNLYNVAVINHSANPVYFSPNDDGRSDTTMINAVLTFPANWTLKIKDKDSHLIRTFNGISTTIGQIWDGKNESSRVGPDGVYTYTIETHDPLTSTFGQPVSGNITLDTLNPVALISQPTNNQLVAGKIEVKGLAKDLNYNGSNYKCYLAYAKETQPGNWHILSYLYNPVVEDSEGNPGMIYSWDASSLEDGMYTLRLLVTDAAGNSSEALLPIHICKVNKYYIEPELFSPNADGIKDVTNIVAAAGKVADWAIAIKNSADIVVRNINAHSQGITQTWDGKNNSGVILADGVYTVIINATDPDTGQNLLTGSGSVEIDNTLPSANITRPTSGSEVNNSVEIKGLASDLHYDGANSILSWGAGSSPTQWNTLAKLSSPVATESVLASWDTSKLKNGAYTLRLLVYDLAGNFRDLKIPVNVYNVRIIDYTDAPDPFTPDNDGDKDTNTITASLSMPLNWRIAITDKGHQPVNNFSGSGDTISQVWDGKNIPRQVVADGVYTYTIDATDPATGTNVQPVSGQITADTAFPLAEITSPHENDTIGSKISILGTASDNNLSLYKVEYGEGESPLGWSLINSSSYPVTNGVLAEWDSAKVNNGIYILKLSVIDIAGHTSTAQVKVNVDNIKITDISIDPDSFNPSNNESINIRYTLDRNAGITIKLYDLDNNLKRTLINNQPRSLGANTEAWNGKEDDGKTIVPVNAYTLTIEAQSGSSRGWYQSSGGFVHNAVTASGFSVTQNFNPYNNELCWIEYTLPKNALLLLQAGKHEEYAGYISIIDWQPRAKGHYLEHWDGRDRKGNILDYYTASFPLIVGYQTQSLPENSVIVTGPQPGSVDVLADPYAFMPAFGDFTNITYTLSAPGNVSVSVRKPSGELIKNLLNNEFKTSGSYTLIWDGRDASDKLVSRDDNYMIKVEFTGQDGKVIVRYGNVTTR